MGVKYGPAPTAPRYYRPKVGSADLTLDEQAAIDGARVVDPVEIDPASSRTTTQSVTARLRAARERTERDREAAAATADRAETNRVNVAKQAEEAKAAGKPHRRLARIERNLARTAAVNARRASGESAPTSFSADEAAAIEAAVKAGKLTRIENGAWDDARTDEERRRALGRWYA